MNALVLAALLAGPPGDPTVCPTLEAATGTALFATANAMATLEAQHFTRVAGGTPSTPPAPWDTSVWPEVTGTPSPEPTPTAMPTPSATPAATPRPRPSPKPTRTPHPTRTQSPASTPTASSTPVLLEAGAWLPFAWKPRHLRSIR